MALFFGADVILLVCINSPIYLFEWLEQSSVKVCKDEGNIRLEKLVPTFELLVLDLDRFDAVYDSHQACLQLLCLSVDDCQFKMSREGKQ